MIYRKPKVAESNFFKKKLVLLKVGYKSIVTVFFNF